MVLACLTPVSFPSFAPLNISTTVGRHNYPGKPALNLVLFMMSLAGLLISVKTIKKPYSLLFIVYFFISLIPTLLTVTTENPNMLRTFTVLPALGFFVGTVMSRITKIKNEKIKTVFPTFLLVLS